MPSELGLTHTHTHTHTLLSFLLTQHNMYMYLRRSTKNSPKDSHVKIAANFSKELSYLLFAQLVLGAVCEEVSHRVRVVVKHL